jgi:hypothetical protein
MGVIKGQRSCGCEYVLYSLGVEEFEAAIIKFGVKEALEYFATPEEMHQSFLDDLKEVE